MELKAGSRWKSAVCTTELAVVRPAKVAVTLECGGRAVIAHAADRPSDGAIVPAHAAGTLLGKRYVDEPSGLEVLCTKAGAGSLSADGRALTMREAKRLPSSD
jgi:hypothetical protein